MSLCIESCVYHSGDVVEASAIKTVFSKRATSGALALSSTKVTFRILNQINFFKTKILFYWCSKWSMYRALLKMVDVNKIHNLCMICANLT